MTHKPDLQFQKFLDENQYSMNGILRYEKIFGRGFVSTGGSETTEEFVKMLDLQPGQKVLEVGCGIGGAAFHMIKNFNVDVVAVDLSTNMLKLAKQRAVELDCDQVEFSMVDITTAQYEPSTFDAIYSKATIIHIKDKESVLNKFLKWLKPGGKLVIADYCLSAEGETASDSFKAYLKQRNYHLVTVNNYGKLLEKCGFVGVKAEDRTQQFSEILDRERKKIEDCHDEFLEEFSQEDYDAIVKGWNDKTVHCADGDQKLGLLQATKPSP